MLYIDAVNVHQFYIHQMNDKQIDSKIIKQKKFKFLFSVRLTNGLTPFRRKNALHDEH